MTKHRLCNPKERGEGSLKSGHNTRHKELQDHNSKTQTQCFEDSHTRAALRKGTSFDKRSLDHTKRTRPLPEWTGYGMLPIHAGRKNEPSVNETDNIPC
jgi:hypothetical protein